MQGTYTPKQPRKIPDGLIWSLLIIMIVLLVLATIGFTLYFVNDSRSGQTMPTPAFVVEPPVQETATLQPEETMTETAVPQEPTLTPVDAVTETPTVIETAGPLLPSPTFAAGATSTPTTIPRQTPIQAPTATALPTAWRGEYYNSRDLSGPAVMIRDDANLAFDWGSAAPATGLPADNFSVRWERSLFFNAGTYRFHVRSDDGVRVWLDNQIIIDQWHDAANVTYSAERFLSAGNHTLIIAYYENAGQASLSFWWDAGDQFPQWQAEYFANATLSGVPALTRNDIEINFDWGRNNPVPGTATDNFSVRWRRSLSFEEGNYRFHALIDDGARIYVDGSLVLDNWRDGSLREVTADRFLSAGIHQIQVEYYERSGDARMRVWWEKISQATYPDWKGEYWSNRQLSGNPTLSRNDANINFDWKGNAPANGMPSDDFSVRWTRTHSFNDGRYRFHAFVDDGVRLYVDNNLIIDQWTDGKPRELTADINLSNGSHTLRVEYFEHGGDAQIRVWWEKLGPISYPDWKGEYWNNRNLQGNPAFTRNDNDINFDWKFNAPHNSLPSDNFSARWSRQLNLEAGVYRFFAKADDGIRVYVDGQPVINEWHDSGGNTTYKADVTLTAGTHAVVIEYYEREFGAEVKVWRERLSGLPTATATATLPPIVTPTATATTPPTAVPPTATPTVVPTATPTVMPTSTPTDIPTATPTVLPPTVTPLPPSTAIGLSPDTGSANDLVTIIGEGYPGKTAVFVHIGPPDEAPFPQPIVSAQSDQGGKVNVSFLMPAAWPNGGMINRDVILVHLATADFQESASASFNYVPADQPALTLSPAQGTLGSVVMITGSGFPATSGIDLYLSAPDNSGDETSYGQTTTSQKGNFVIQFTLPLTWANGKPITGNTLRIAASGENNIQAAADFLLLTGTIE